MRWGRNPWLRWAILSALFCAAFAGTLDAAEAPRGKITVNGTGTAEVKPDAAEIHTSITGNATLAADAIKKFRENRRRAFELLHKLDVKGVVVEGRGPIITSVAANNNQQGGAVLFNFGINGAGQATPQTAGMNCAETLVVRVPQIDRMKQEDVIDAVVKVLDVCKDAGLTVASVEFKSTQMESHKAAAMRAAVDAARHKAELLASLSHARVGPVLSIQETSPVPGALENLAQAAADFDASSALNGFNIQVAGSSPLAAITVRATVNVEFVLERGN
jgi:uncharacterized protein YggE